MNEKIRELADQAKQYCFEQSQKRLDPEEYMPYSDMYDKKFAELIVAECVEIMNQTEQVPVGFTQIKSAAIHSTMLRRHFGIEYKRED